MPWIPRFRGATGPNDLTSDKCCSYSLRRQMSLTLPTSTSMPARAADRLSRREREIMNAVFALGNRAVAEEIRERLPNPPTLSAIRVMLARLETKGQLRHEHVAGRNIYSATTSPGAAKRAALRQYLQTFFGGSLRDMMMTLVRNEAWSDDDLEALRGEINRVRKQRRSS